MGQYTFYFLVLVFILYLYRKVHKQGEKINKQGEKINKQGEKINKQGEKINKQEELINVQDKLIYLQKKEIDNLKYARLVRIKIKRERDALNKPAVNKHRSKKDSGRS